MKIVFFIIVALIALATPSVADENEGVRHMNITSPAFKNNGFIPSKFTCQGEDINPTLIIEDIPEGTKSLALILDDPDAPMGTWVHWILYNVPVISRIEEGSIPGKQGFNDFRGTDYGGPCPPFGTHRYVFRLYALDVILDMEEGAGRNALERAMEGHILERAELTGLYKKH